MQPRLGNDDLLLPECHSRIFQFLSLKECLVLAAASRGCLRIIMPELQARRRVQFLCRHEQQNALCRETPPRIRPVPLDAPAPTSDTPFLHPIETVQNDPEFWCLMPSVKERLESLYSALPAEHPMNEDLRLLVLDLQDGDDDNTRFAVERNENNLVTKLQDVARAHRLHATMLRRCTVDVNPDLFTTQSIYTTAENANTDLRLTISLARYVGDVSLASTLMAHSAGLMGIVEGGPSLGLWVERLKNLEPDNAVIKDTKSWYQIMVYLHAAVLRTSLSNASQFHELRRIVTGIQLGTIDNISASFIPLSCFDSALDQTVAEMSSSRAEHENGDFRRAVLRVRFMSFGTLHAFRGRDNVHL
ncbi:MAG: hypothetical protein SGARI_000903 [Bacillariaceae sp.]